MSVMVKDPVSGLTHFIGACLAVAGLVLLVTKAAVAGKPWHVVSFSIFGAGMVLLYTASTIYHWIPAAGKARARLQKLDHMMIFVLIAATYTPVCLVALRGGWGWSLFGAVWFFALVGIVLNFFHVGENRLVSTAFYVGMGWLAIVGIWPLARVLQPGALLWLLAGGIFYTAGALIYAGKRPDPWPSCFGYHEIFHLFVMAGTFSHFWMMYRYIAAIA